MSLQLLTINNLATSPGEKKQGYIHVEGTEVKMPTTVIHGNEEGKTILITGGVHGGEYPCIETAIQLARYLEPSEVKGTLIIIHPVNVPAFLAKLQYYGPYDGKNLNRVFPGKALGTVSERIAYTVNQLQQEADFFIDLHGGDIHEGLVPFVIYSKIGGDELANVSAEAAKKVGFPYVVGSISEGGSIAGAAKVGTPGFLAELGQCGRWTQVEVDHYIKGIKNVLVHLEVLGQKMEVDEPLHMLDRMAVYKAEHEGCWYPEHGLNEQLEKGDKLGEIRDFFGNTLSEYYAEEDGIVLYVVTSLAITVGDPLIALGVS